MKLYKDVLLNVRRSLAASLHEVLKLVDMTSKENQNFFIEVLTHYSSADIEEVKGKVSDNLCTIVLSYPEEEHSILLNTIVKECLVS